VTNGSTASTLADVPYRAWYDRRVAVVSDLEGTLTTGETWRALGREAALRIGWARYLAFVARRLPAMARVRAGRASKRAFQDAWLTGLARCFAGVGEAEFEALAARAVDAELWPKRRHDVIAALRVHLASGEPLLIASGSLHPLVSAFAMRLGEATGQRVQALGTPLELEGGRLTGRLAGRITVGEEKARRVHELLGSERLAVAYGDAGTDVPLLLLADAPVAVYPDATLRRTASELGWAVLDG
jgi:HAD superfamily phosphoserine phosphatase-like hydrolase